MMRWIWMALPMLGSCVGRASLEDAPTDTTADASTSNAGSSTGMITTSSTTDVDATSTSGTTLRSDGSSEGDADWSGGCTPFLCEPDNGAEPCDLWAQNCPRGEKCMPRAAEGEYSWSETVCSPIAEDPAAPGEPCTAEGAGVLGIDDCAAGAMCWNVDAETDAGTCVALCMGSAQNPICSDPAMMCRIYNEGVLILCLAQCDPVAQDCGETEACWADGDAFVCKPYTQSNAGAGDPCTPPRPWDDCGAGLFCADASTVPECAAETCCSSFCDLGAADPDAACLEGQVCVPWYDAGTGPPDLAHVGACALP